MSSFIVVFEWPAIARLAARTEKLDAQNPENAKIEAALMYGCEPFELGLPTRYMIFNDTGGLVFSYPETG